MQEGNEGNTTITLALTGASGACYGLRLLQQLVQHDCRVFVLISSAARIVLQTEESIELPEGTEAITTMLSERYEAMPGQIRVLGNMDWFSPVASGSGAPKQMVVCPCSTGTLSAIANGASDNLMERAADVVLKERGQLVLVPREMPLSAIHLENMLKLARMNALIFPASPSFYTRPETREDIVDTVVSRILDHLGIEHQLRPRWGYDS